ncbi:MAG: LCP family protein [Actinobacteria bacterium]|nr:LCP family protein [Actinomycetota bacterium]
MAKTIEQRPAVGPGGAVPGRRPRRLRLVLLAASSFLALSVSAAAVTGFGLYVWAENEFQESEIPVDRPGGLTEIDTPCDPVCNYLLLGSDSRAGLSEEEQELHGNEETVAGQRADTIILVHVDPDREKAIVVHFPRDLWVEIPGRGMDRINAAFEGGPNLMVATIERLTGIDLNHYVGINLAGFESTVDAMGGVRICVDRPMIDPLANLKLRSAGCYDMDGRTALAFVRARHVEGDCIPDFSRIGRQQQFLRAVMGRLLSPTMLPRLPSLIRETVPNLPHDSELQLADLVALTNSLKGIGTGAVDFRAVPGTVGWEGEKSVVHVDPEAETLFRRLRQGKPLGPIGVQLESTRLSPANVRLEVVDDGAGGTAAEVHSLLTDAGFAVLGAGSDVPAGVEGSAIVFRGGRRVAADVVARFLPELPLLRAPGALPEGVDVVVVIGPDYAGPSIVASPSGGAGEGGGGAPPPECP